MMPRLFPYTGPVMTVTLGKKLFVYTGGLLVGLTLTTLLLLERSQSRQWERHFITQSVSFAKLATPELLKRFRGEFVAAERTLGQELFDFLAFNRDLVDFDLLSLSGRQLFRSSRFPDFIDYDPGAALQRLPVPYAVDPSGLEAVVLLPAKGHRLLEMTIPAFGPTGERVLLVRYRLSFASVDMRIREVRTHFLLIALASLAFSLLLAALVAGRVTRSIKALTQGVRTITRGDLAARIEADGRDEIATLGRAFNEMAASLRRSDNELKEKNQALVAANDELLQIQQHLIRAERLAAIGQLAAGVSHEIDNPVGIILGYAELLLEDTPPGDPRADDLQAIVDECKRCRRITGGLLGFARGNLGCYEPMELAQLTRDTVDSLRPQKIFRDIAVVLQLGSVPVVIEGDADQIRQVLVNLLLNAAQAMQGTGSLRIALDTTAAGCRLLVADSGPGVPGELQGKIFEPFFSTKDRGAGTGLGLSICRRLVEDHGGRLTVETKPGGGATFVLELPWRRAEKVFDIARQNSLG
ncbi:MAG: hypothetical protein A2005_07550 [Desulfuromonadales bacterium GWC2_61_20]|nr:MAG: hypothetical protein A2005_07550 [Desulfuromonadales bacterium GWC2_61_20]HAD03847.1 hypothetical protein [Desulfuromonas sp.]